MRDLHPENAVHATSIPPLSAYALSLIDKLDLSAHPEGGWYKRTWQSPLTHSNGRPLASLIYFLLPEGDYSDWHLVDADELWLWHGPAPLEIEITSCDPRATPEEELSKQTQKRLLYLDSSDMSDKREDTTTSRYATQCLVPAGMWQRTRPTSGDALASCVVSPGFTFDGFTVID